VAKATDSGGNVCEPGFAWHVRRRERRAVITMPDEQPSPIENRMRGSDRTITIGLVDEHSLSRQCLARSLQEFGEIFRISQFASCNDCLLSEKIFDVILYHAHETFRNLNKNSEGTTRALKKLQQISSVIILSSIDGPHFVIKAFEGGARGFIPTPSTTIEMVIEIIRLVSAGGTFVPPSGLRLGKINSEGTPRATISGYEFTPREMAVLDRLALGKANKIIAHELKMSESTVKVHIKRIMTKLKATNRTEVICRAFDLPAIVALSRHEA